MNGRLFRGLAGLVGLFVIWQVACQIGLVDPTELPPPTAVGARLVALLGQSDFQVALVATVSTWIVSLLITIAIAVVLGMLLGSLPGVRTAASTVIEFIRPIPAVALIPVSTVLLGGGSVTTISLAVFAGVWPILFAVVAEIRETDPLLIDTARTYGLGRFAIAVRVRLPAVARATVTGLRIALALELIVIVSVGLLTGIDGGLGAYLWNAGEAVGDATTVLAGTVIIGIIGYAANLGLGSLQNIRKLHAVSSTTPEVETARSSRWAVRMAQRWGTFIVLVAIWQWAASRADNVFAPSPTMIAQSAWTNLSTLGTSIPLSLERMGIAWGISVVAGVGLGLVLGLLPKAADVFEPVTAFIRAIPPVLLIPIIVIWTHLGVGLEITTITLGCAFPILVNTIEGVRTIDPVLLHTSLSYRTGRLRHLATVVAPAAAPKIVTGLRISLSIALILMVISEIIGATSGLGFEITAAGGQVDYPLMWAVLVVLGILGFVLNQLLVTADRRLLSWQRTPAAEG
jgi:ABC-type nitrate/sulfonate/bicarbonate transport system permease component